MNSELTGPGILLDRSKLDAKAYVMSGALEAMHAVLEMMQSIFIQTPHAEERRAIEAIMEVVEERADELARETNMHAAKLGALRLSDGSRL